MASFLRREPKHSLQSISSMNSLAHRFTDVEGDSLYWFFIKLDMPSNSILYSFVIPNDFDSTVNFSLPP